MNNNNQGSSQIRIYGKQSKPNPMRTALVLLMTAVILAFIVIFIMSLTGTGMFSDKKNDGDKGGNSPETSVSTSEEEVEPPVQSSSDIDPVSPTGVIYTFATKKSEDVGIGDLVLINNDHLYTFKENNYLDNVMNYRDGYKDYYSISFTTFQLKSKVFTQLNSIMKDFCTENPDSEIKVNLTNAFRSFDEQKELFDKPGSGASTPGASDYHSGSTLLINGVDRKTGKTVSLSKYEETSWLKQNAHKYGFIFRSPADKKASVGYTIEWQMRHVGIPHAEYMYKNNLCLEEYLELLSTDYRYKDNGSKNLVVECEDGKTYEIYYVEGVTEAGTETKIPVPENRKFTVSGDNIKGFIVTVTVEE